MIGGVGTGASFYHCLSYCLEDKRELTEQQKKELSLKGQVQHSGRAEVLEYNLCFGNKHELTRQFRDVQKLNGRVKKPVFHLSLRLAPGDHLDKDQLMEIGRECAEEFGVAGNQYICVLHKDTAEPHIHIVANRIGLDGKTASDSQSYRRMATLCRKLEKQYGLKEVLSPRRFLSPEERLRPRHDTRRERLQDDIRQTLKTVSDFPTFKQQMEALGYQVEKGRGIAFIDDKKVRIKGSEVKFSLATIEKILALKQQLDTQKPVRRQRLSPETEKNRPVKESYREDYAQAMAVRSIQKTLDILLNPVSDSGYAEEYIPFEWKKKRKKKKGLRPR